MISRRILRTGVLAVAGALLVYAVSGFLVVPAVLEWQLLKNIRERLATYYGKKASLTLKIDRVSGTTAELSIPVKRRSAEKI